jgi:predicted permease
MSLRDDPIQEPAPMSKGWFTGVFLDARHTTRSLRRQPLFGAAVVLSLGLGIGTLTAVVTFAEVTLLRPLPVDAPDQLVQLDWQTREWFPDMPRFVGTGVIAPVPTSPTFPGAAFAPLRTAAADLADLFAFGEPTSISAAVHGEARDARLQLVSGNYFTALRLRPASGRLLGAADDRAAAPPAAVISHRFWQRLGADPALVGAPLVLDGVPFTIAGIAPAGFRGVVITAPAPPDVWVPLAFSGRLSWIRDEASLWWLSLMARLGDGVVSERLGERLQHPMQAAVTSVATTKADDLPIVRVRPGRRGLIDDTFDDMLEYALTLIAIFTALLAVLCANVANLMFARGIARREEMSVRLALGADRMRLLRHLVSEGVLLALAGSVVGLFVATWGMEYLAATTLLPAVGETSLNIATLAVTTLVALAVGLAISLFPAIRATASRHDLRIEGLMRRRSTTSRTSGALLSAQVALAVVLLMGGSLLIRTLGKSSGVDPGFNGSQLLLFEVKPDLLRFGEGPGTDLVDRIVDRVKSVPGVASATASGPFLGKLWPGRIVVDGRTARVEPRWLPVRQDFFQVLQLPVRAGRTFDAADMTSRPPRVTVIDEDLAQALFGRTSPLGRRIGFKEGGPAVEVIGVVGRISLGGSRPADRRPTLYFPAATQRADFDPKNIALRGSYRDTYGTTLAVRYRSAATSIVEDIRRGVAKLDSTLVITAPKTVAQIIGERLEPTRILASLWLAFGGATLSITLLGLFGTMSHAATRRTREIAIRIALGARQRAVVRLVVAQTVLIAVVGIVGGLLLSTLALQVLRSYLHGVSAYDPAAIAGVIGLVLVACVWAAIVPVRRALKVDPSAALRWE